MTSKSVKSSIGLTDSGEVPMGILDYEYTPFERDSLDEMRSWFNVSRALVAARSETGLTQAEVGRQAGTKQSRVSELEAMKGNPRFDTLDRISRVLGLMIALVPRHPAPVRSENYQFSPVLSQRAVATQTEMGAFTAGVAR